ncbi:hypothetical protein [Aminobacter niigataensis]|uniref:hypothetical protein n=1 Tax=Aminobacter niigataensis TaxID=83265 RepID=UPI0024C9F89C|nr:hypothetical protein [Aminobacter niigataensis]CAI2936043.1 conserved protein of unknown function [Aminobacter niigataensis]
MKLKMLESMAGRDFSISVGEVTDRFSDKEAARFIKAGLAEKAPVEPVKKPDTKKEWDDERAMLLEENARLISENEAAKSRENEMVEQIEALAAFKAAVVAALGEKPVVQEPTNAVALPETRG